MRTLTGWPGDVGHDAALDPQRPAGDGERSAARPRRPPRPAGRCDRVGLGPLGVRSRGDRRGRQQREQRTSAKQREGRPGGASGADARRAVGRQAPLRARPHDRRAGEHRHGRRRRPPAAASRRPTSPRRSPNASALLSACSAMHGSSEPVRSRTTHSMTPRIASGTRKTASAEPAWIAAEHEPGQQRRRPRAAPVAQRAEEVAAEEHLLGDRRDHGHEHADGDERGGALVDAEAVGQLVLRVGVDDQRPTARPSPT